MNIEELTVKKVGKWFDPCRWEASARVNNCYKVDYAFTKNEAVRSLFTLIAKDVCKQLSPSYGGV